MGDLPFPGRLPVNEEGIALNQVTRHSVSTGDVLTNFHADIHCAEPRRQSDATIQSAGFISPSHAEVQRQRTQISFGNDVLPSGNDEPVSDEEDPGTVKPRRISVMSGLPGWTGLKPSALPDHQSVEKLAEEVEHLLPCRGNLPVQIYDFGDGRTAKKLISLGEVETEMFEKPDWSVVRWIHAPLGVGLYHSSLEDIFLNGVGQDLHDVHRSSMALPKGRYFKKAGRAGWPYLETEIINVRSFAATEQTRNAALILRDNSDVQKLLNEKMYNADHNEYLQKDVRWRAHHLGLEPTYWETAKSDLPWLLTDGALNMKSPAAVARETNLTLKKQTLQDHPAYKDAYIARDSFRCFHRGDGYVLSLSPAKGIDYLNKNLPDMIRDECERQRVAPRQTQYQEPEEEKLLWPGEKTSAIAHVYAEFEEEGVRNWSQRTPEWLIVFLITEIAITPHGIRSGYAAPSILDAYDANVHKLIEQKFSSWKRKETVSLVRKYLESIDELSALGQIYRTKLKYLRRLEEDCKQIEEDHRQMNEATPSDEEDQESHHFQALLTMTGRVQFAMTALEDLSAQCDQLTTDLTASLNALFQLRSIEQNERSITADSQSRAVLVFTIVTIIFLPLSFMSSYFSMNVEGISGGTPPHTQGDFWKICGPFTISIVLAVAYYAWWDRRQQAVRTALPSPEM